MRSRARGGSLDEVLLTAPARWDGRVKQDSRGRYVWTSEGWRWQLDKSDEKSRRVVR